MIAGRRVVLALALAVVGCSSDTIQPLVEEPVPVPANLRIAPPSFTELGISWDQPASEITVALERSTASGGPVVIAQALSITSYTDTQLASDTHYCYRVRSERGSEVSAWSAAVCERTRARLAEPAALQLTTSGDSLVRLKWTDAAAAEDGYRIERRTGTSVAQPYVLLATLPPNAVAYDDHTVDAFTTYCYRISSVHAAEAPRSAEKCVQSGAPQIGQWRTARALPTPRQEMNAAVIGGEIFVPGGLNAAGTSLSVMEVYNPVTDTWRAAAPMPEARHHHGVIAIGSRLYVLGGFTPGSYPWAASRDVFIYEAGTDTWSTGAPMPEDLGGLAAAVVDGEIYVVGGAHHGTNAVAHLYAFNPGTNEWRQLPDMPTAREHLAAVGVNGALYVIGGRRTTDPARFAETTENDASLEIYNPQAGSWSRGTSMPTARGGLFATAVQGRLYAMGGEFPGVFANVEEYDTQGNSWRQVSPMPTPRHAAAIAVVNGVIHTIGGGTWFGFGHSTVHEVYTPPGTTPR